MNLKEQYKNQIDELSSKSFNKDQKDLAKRILDAAPENEVDKWFQLLIQKVKLGFTFDSAPEVFEGAISLLEEDKSRRINVQEEAEENENLLIVGENYDALKNLLITHRNKIDIIYIDPPYNTGKSKADNNSLSNDDIGVKNKFIYRDKFARTGWLNLLKERLLLAKQLLSDEGVIFVSIDDTEQAYLKILMDEIFGEENFIASMPRILKKGGKSTESISKTHDYILVYSKVHNKKFKGLKISNNDYNLKDEFIHTRGPFHLKQTLDYSSLQYSKNMDFKITFNNEDFYPGGYDSYNKRLNGEIKKIDWVWRWSKKKVEAAKKFDFFVKKGNRIYTKTYFNSSLEKVGDKYIVKDKNREKSLETTHFVLENKYNNDNSKKELGNILEKGLFDYPKPITLIIELIKLVNNNIIILDFFAGSGTTGHAVMELNKEDNGNRKFILVTNNENNIAHEITYERLHRIIKGEGTKGEKDFKWLDQNKPYSDVKLRVFNINQYKTTLNDDPKDLLIKAQKAFQKIHKNYQKESIDIYTDLNSLHPYKEEKEN